MTTFKKLTNFAKALYNHVRTGMKKSSQKLIDKRYSICLGCEHYEFKVNFDEEYHKKNLELSKKCKCRQKEFSNKIQKTGIKASCKLCGCNLSDKKVFLNKLAWKDQKCPADKW